jgi:hypothetical protein
MDDRVQPVQVFPPGTAGNLLNGQLGARLGEGTVDAGGSSVHDDQSRAVLEHQPAYDLLGQVGRVTAAIAGHDAAHTEIACGW